MIEPTETESRTTLDAFADAVREIVELARSDPEELRAEPRHLPVGRLDEVRAARNPVLRWRPGDDEPAPGRERQRRGEQGGPPAGEPARQAGSGVAAPASAKEAGTNGREAEPGPGAAEPVDPGREPSGV